MSNNSCIAAEKHGMCFLRMARVNCRILLLLDTQQFSPHIHKSVCFAAGAALRPNCYYCIISFLKKDWTFVLIQIII